MALALLCDEHIPYPVIQGLGRRGVDVTTVQQLGMRGALDLGSFCKQPDNKGE